MNHALCISLSLLLCSTFAKATSLLEGQISPSERISQKTKGQARKKYSSESSSYKINLPVPVYMGSQLTTVLRYSNSHALESYDSSNQAYDQIALGGFLLWKKPQTTDEGVGFWEQFKEAKHTMFTGFSVYDRNHSLSDMTMREYIVGTRLNHSSNPDYSLQLAYRLRQYPSQDLHSLDILLYYNPQYSKFEFKIGSSQLGALYKLTPNEDIGITGYLATSSRRYEQNDTEFWDLGILAAVQAFYSYKIIQEVAILGYISMHHVKETSIDDHKEEVGERERYSFANLGLKVVSTI